MATKTIAKIRTQVDDTPDEQSRKRRAANDLAQALVGLAAVFEEFAIGLSVEGFGRAELDRVACSAIAGRVLAERLRDAVGELCQ